MEGYYRFSELKERGWTAGLVEKFLKTCDTTRPNPYYRGGAEMKLYLKERVERVETSTDFLSAKVKAGKQKEAGAKAVQTKQTKLLEYVAGLEIKVEALPTEEVIRLACRQYNEWKFNKEDYYGEPASVHSDLAFLERITVNYLRHQLSCYDEELNRIAGKVGVGKAYLALNEKVYAAIAVAYPELSGECQHQLSRKSGER